jgi:hypothetical protein
LSVAALSVASSLDAPQLVQPGGERRQRGRQRIERDACQRAEDDGQLGRREGRRVQREGEDGAEGVLEGVSS